MLWLKGRKCRTLDQRRELVFVAAQCARLALPIWESRYPTDDRVSQCLDACEAWSRGAISDAALAAARDAAHTAAIYADAANDAASAATHAASSANAANDAVYAIDVRSAAAVHSAKKDTLNACAVIVRSKYPKP